LPQPAVPAGWGNNDGGWPGYTARKVPSSVLVNGKEYPLTAEQQRQLSQRYNGKDTATQTQAPSQQSPHTCHTRKKMPAKAFTRKKAEQFDATIADFEKRIGYRLDSDTYDFNFGQQPQAQGFDNVFSPPLFPGQQGLLLFTPSQPIGRATGAYSGQAGQLGFGGVVPGLPPTTQTTPPTAPPAGGGRIGGPTGTGLGAGVGGGAMNRAQTATVAQYPQPQQQPQFPPQPLAQNQRLQHHKQRRQQYQQAEAIIGGAQTQAATTVVIGASRRQTVALAAVHQRQSAAVHQRRHHRHHQGRQLT
ncbi:MAG: hypothetical protein LE168_02805, partial [Endomicrobium sp.]|nr:hypothetical protein [Endomicrobium sp.]